MKNDPREELLRELKKLQPLDTYELERIKSRTRSIQDSFDMLQKVNHCGEAGYSLEDVENNLRNIQSNLETLEPLLVQLKKRLPAYKQEVIKLAKEFNKMNGQRKVKSLKIQIKERQQEIEGLKRQLQDIG